MHPSRGRIVQHDGYRLITLDPTLGRVDRNGVLSHELVHDELDLLWPPGTPEGIVQKGERLVERISDERLLPPGELAAWVAKREEQMTLVRDVCDEFDIPADVADRSLRRLVAGF